VSARSLEILVGADLHNETRHAHWFYDVAEERRPELIIFLGDFITGEPLSETRDMLAALRHLAPACFVIPGNWDPRETLVAIDEAAFDGLRNLHKAAAWCSGYSFAGLGGSTTTPSGQSPFELPDAGFADPLLPFLPVDVWVLHNPLLGINDRVPGGMNVGSASLLKLLRQQQERPLLVLSGHIHDARGVQVLALPHEKQSGERQELAQLPSEALQEVEEAAPPVTTFVNPGPLLEGCAAWIRLDEQSVGVEMLDSSGS
jgi:Icc-related predicted phosphoesterase